jgi:hypothetical protein
MTEAERITQEELSLSRIAVIAGVGVRGYYRRLGYELEATYMVKELLKPVKPVPVPGVQGSGDEPCTFGHGTVCG